MTDTVLSRPDEEQDAPGRSLAPARAELRAFHQRTTSGPLFRFGGMVGLYALALVAVLAVDALGARLAASAVLAVMAGRLFLIGHDAAHGSFVPSRAGNGLVGRVAFAPSLHAYALWRDAHDEHHRWTNLAGRDLVWTPLSPAEFAARGPLGRASERLFRSRTAVGLGPHYVTRIWLPRMIVPRRVGSTGRSVAHVVDSVLLLVAGAGLGLVVYRLGVLFDPGRADDAGYWVVTVVLVLVVPFVYVSYAIGFVIYLNHTHPSVRWYDDEGLWRHWARQLDGATDVEFPKRWHVLLPRPVMHHVAHHVDPGVPLSRLAAAQARLDEAFPARITRCRWSVAEFRRILAGCKLYDYEGGRWLDFAGRATTTTAGSAPSSTGS